MSFQTMTLMPGVNVEKTPALLQAGISDANLIRFKDGLTQKLGGWEKFYDFPIESEIRALHAWQGLNVEKHLAVGAEESLSVITDGVNSDITPRTRTANIPPEFSTTSGDDVVTIGDTGSSVTIYDFVFVAVPVSIGGIIISGLYPITNSLGADAYRITAAEDATATEGPGGVVPVFTTAADSSSVNVELPDHGLSVGDFFNFFVATEVGGIEISGTYEVISVADSDNFTIAASSAADSNDTQSMNGGDVRLIYYIAVGVAEGSAGYSIGGYSEGGFGTGVAPPANPGTPITADNWTLDNWGNILMACPINGGIYYWSPSGQFSTARLIGNAPIVNTGIFVAMPQRILVAFGSSIDGVQDPLLIKWSDVENFNQWTPSTQNQAGSFRLSTGSKIVGAMQGPQQAFIWTDTSLWTMQYQGPPYVFGFTEVSTGCGMVGLHSMAKLGTSIYWMNQGGFLVTTGGGIPKSIPCPVWDAVFQELDRDNLDKICCAANSTFDEVTWYYPSNSGGGEIDKYVKFNKTENTWDLGGLQRTAWIDQSVLGQPIGADAAGNIYQHETSNDADGEAMDSYFESGWFVIAEGTEFPYIDWILPDFKYGFRNGAQNAEIKVTIYTANYPNGPVTTHGPYTFNSASEYASPRARGRLAKIRVESTDLDSFWRIGALRFRWAPSGRR